jgi:hypothetical protein
VKSEGRNKNAMLGFGPAVIEHKRHWTAGSAPIFAGTNLNSVEMILISAGCGALEDG